MLGWGVILVMCVCLGECGRHGSGLDVFLGECGFQCFRY